MARLAQPLARQLASPLGRTVPHPAIEGVGEVFTAKLIGKIVEKQGVIIGRGGPGTWDEGLVESLSRPYWDATLSKWVGFYVGYNGAVTIAQIGMATADTPGGTWTKDPSNPVYTPSGTPGAPDEKGVSGPVAYVEGVTLYLYHVGLTSLGYESGQKSLCLASRPLTGGAWTRLGAIILPQGSGWAANAIWHVTPPIKRGSTYYMFFNASDGSNVESIGYATSTSPAGPWTVSALPVIERSGTGWESGHVADPSLYGDSQRAYLGYAGFQTSTLYSSDGLASTPWSSFPAGPWVKDTDSPILVPSETYEGSIAAKPSILLDQGEHYHFYRSGDPAFGAIALAKGALTPQNFLTAKDNFADGAWTKVGVTAPAADQIKPTGVGNHRIGQLRSVSSRAGIRHSFAVKMATGGYGKTRVAIFKSSVSGPTAGGFFDVDLTTGGVITVATAFGGLTNPVATILSWDGSEVDAQIEVTANGSSGTVYGVVGVLNAAGAESFTADGTSFVYAWDARMGVVPGAI